uniref:Uncharacterized protein n=1 Tax=Oryza meridionalis TaxID=40149 RepID=A0A0E0EJ28_9ORYZ
MARPKAIPNLLGLPSRVLSPPIHGFLPQFPFLQERKTGVVACSLPFLQENHDLLPPLPHPQSHQFDRRQPPCPLLTDRFLKTQSQGSASSVPNNPAVSSCRKKSDDATFLKDLKDHINEFIHASMDEHKHCFKNTIQKMFGMSKVVTERSAEAKEAEVESALPLQNSVSQ